MDICEAAGGRFFVIEPLAGRRIVAQGKREAGAPGPLSPRAPPWVSVPTRSTLSPNPFVGLGERAGVRGKDPAELRKSRFRAKKCLENNETQDSTFGNQWPPSPDLSPRIAEKQRFGGRGEQRVGTLTQGGARGDGGPEAPALACPGLPSDALTGLPR